MYKYELRIELFTPALYHFNKKQLLNPNAYIQN